MGAEQFAVARLGSDTIGFGNALTGQAKYAIGERAFRRDSGQRWGIGYVTSVDPLEVTVLDDPHDKSGYSWDEVRSLEDILTPAEVAEQLHLDSLPADRVRHVIGVSFGGADIYDGLDWLAR